MLQGDIGVYDDGSKRVGSIYGNMDDRPIFGNEGIVVFIIEDDG